MSLFDQTRLGECFLCHENRDGFRHPRRLCPNRSKLPLHSPSAPATMPVQHCLEHANACLHLLTVVKLQQHVIWLQSVLLGRLLNACPVPAVSSVSPIVSSLSPVSSSSSPVVVPVAVPVVPVAEGKRAVPSVEPVSLAPIAPDRCSAAAACSVVVDVRPSEGSAAGTCSCCLPRAWR